MHFCVNGRHPYSVLKQADEVKFNYNDKDKILDLLEKYPDKVVILDVPGAESDWKLWTMYSEMFAGFHVALHDLGRVAEFNEHDINWYWPYPITSFYELGMIVNLHPSFVLIGAPLTFDLATVRNQTVDDCTQKHIPVRMVVNVAHPGYLPTYGTHGVCGQWVRPEDVKAYAQYVSSFEFGEVDLRQEEVLLQIYKEKQEWLGNLNLIIKKLDFNVDNRAIPENLGERRMTCGQRCWRGGACQLCVTSFMFAEQIRKEAQARRQEATIDNN